MYDNSIQSLAKQNDHKLKHELAFLSLNDVLNGSKEFSNLKRDPLSNI